MYVGITVVLTREKEECYEEQGRSELHLSRCLDWTLESSAMQSLLVADSLTGVAKKSRWWKERIENGEWIKESSFKDRLADFWEISLKFWKAWNIERRKALGALESLKVKISTFYFWYHLNTTRLGVAVYVCYVRGELRQVLRLRHCAVTAYVHT